MAKRSRKTVKRNLVNPSMPSSSWKGSIYSSTISIFTGEGRLNGAFSDVGKLSLWGLTIPGEDDRICNEYGNCNIPLYKYLFTTLGVCFPFTAFEGGVFNYLMVAPSQLIPLVGHT